mmetsp:Transcript_27069/g.23920  ORF Transcript_27069/g.23920 Transcript_27069/m.23920 type:complete len:137 (+) Transcript_27069:237-647(+)
MNMPKVRIRGGGLDKTKGFSFMSETEYLGKSSPSVGQYEINEKLVSKRATGYKIVKPKNNKMNWKPVKKSGAAVGLYKTDSELFMPKSPRTIVGKEKLRSVLDGIIRLKKKIPGVGQYDHHLCIDKISRPMRTSRV